MDILTSVAISLRENQPTKQWLNKRLQWRYDCINIATALDKEIREFNKWGFLQACGLDKEEMEEVKEKDTKSGS